MTEANFNVDKFIANHYHDGSFNSSRQGSVSVSSRFIKYGNMESGTVAATPSNQEETFTVYNRQTNERQEEIHAFMGYVCNRK